MNGLNRPHLVAPAKETARVIFAVKNFAAIRGVCHIGLGVTALNNMKVLRREGFYVETWAAQTAGELEKQLEEAFSRPHHKHAYVPITHVVVSAPSWVQPEDFSRLCFKYPDVHFVQLNHSGCAYLSIDKFGIRNIKAATELQLSLHNFSIAGNNTRFVEWVERGLHSPCLYLPNLYDTHSFINHAHRPVGDTLRIGSFGASRPWKNQLTAAEASVQLARQMGLRLELYVNSKRPDGGERMIESRCELFAGEPDCKLIEVPWKPWPQFRSVIGKMHLGVQNSHDETFDVCAADGIAMGIPSITSQAIEWTPKRWWADCCDPSDLVKVGLYLLNDKYAIDDARKGLKDYVANGIRKWEKFITVPQ